MTLRVLFLDVDGVLNSNAYLAANPGAFDRGGPEGYLSMFDDAACARLEVVTRVTGAKIVISSSWRFVHTLGQMRGYLAAKGVTAEVIDFTPIGYNPDLPGDDSFGTKMTCRGHEIAAWVDAHPELDAYAVVDDNSDMDGVRDRFVQTTWERGLLDEHMLPLVRTLMRPRAFTPGQHVHVYGVRVHRSEGPAGDGLDLNTKLDAYELGRVLAVEPATARVRLVNHPTEFDVVRERLSLPFPSWQQLAYGLAKGSPP